MAATYALPCDDCDRARGPYDSAAIARPGKKASAVSWGAVIAGTAGAAALALILLLVGAGLGLSSVSPWVPGGASGTSFDATTVAWLMLTQLVASGAGGCLAGRLRKRWVAVPTGGVYFGDIAHDFLAWAAVSLATAALLGVVIWAIVRAGAQADALDAGSAGVVAAATLGAAAAPAGSPLARTGSDSGLVSYFVDSLYRKDLAAARLDNGTIARPDAPSPEVTGIFMNALWLRALPDDDLRYASEVVAQRTGLTQQQAQGRVRDTYARLKAKLRDAEVAARVTAEKAQKVPAYGPLWLFVSLLIGAFVASLTATRGRRQHRASYPIRHGIQL